jgi:carboxypeptidase Taq
MTATAYERLVEKLKRAHHLGTVAGLLGWDEQVNLPPDSADQRAEQLALLAELQHAAASDPEIGTLLAELAPASAAQSTSNLIGYTFPQDADRAVVVREARRDYERVVKLPAAFVA